MKNRPSRRMTGETSTPPRLGSMRRIGRRTGSVNLKSRSTTTRMNWLRTFTTPNDTSQLMIALAITIQV